MGFEWLGNQCYKRKGGSFKNYLPEIDAIRGLLETPVVFRVIFFSGTSIIVIIFSLQLVSLEEVSYFCIAHVCEGNTSQHGNKKERDK